MFTHDYTQPASGYSSFVMITCLNQAVVRTDDDDAEAHWRLDVAGVEVGQYAFLDDAQTIGEMEYGVSIWLHDPASETFIGTSEEAQRQALLPISCRPFGRTRARAEHAKPLPHLNPALQA